MSRACPGGSTGPSRAPRRLPREGAVRRAGPSHGLPGQALPPVTIHSNWGSISSCRHGSSSGCRLTGTCRLCSFLYSLHAISALSGALRAPSPRFGGFLSAIAFYSTAAAAFVLVRSGCLDALRGAPAEIRRGPLPLRHAMGCMSVGISLLKAHESFRDCKSYRCRKRWV